MSYFAIADTVLIFAVLLFFLIRTFLRRKKPRCSVSEPPLPVWLMAEFIAALCILLLFVDFDESNDLVSLLYGLFTIPLTAVLLYCTGRESMQATEEGILYTPAIGKKQLIPYREISGYSRNPMGGLLLFCAGKADRYIGADGGISYLHPDRVAESLRSNGVKELSYDNISGQRALYIASLPKSEEGRMVLRRRRSQSVRVTGWILTHFTAISGILFFYRGKLYPAVGLLFLSAAVFLVFCFLADRIAQPKDSPEKPEKADDGGTRS